MQKNYVKSFVCSFVCSVLAVAAVQKVFFRAPEIKKTDSSADIKVQNISLFQKTAADADVIPQIEASPQSKIDVSSIDALAVEPAKSAEPTVQTAELDILSVTQPVFQYDPKTQYEVSTELSQASEITLDAADIQDLNETKKHSESGIVYADISDTFTPEGMQNIETPQDAMQVAQNNISSSDEQIPLSENTNAIHQQISVQDRAPASQIAMIEPTALINSIEQTDILEDEKNLADADIKKREVGTILDIAHTTEPEIDETAWEKAEVAAQDGTVVSALSDESDSDDPWVMAKGNKYAKNQAVVEEFNKKEQERQAAQAIKKTENEDATVQAEPDKTDQAERAQTSESIEQSDAENQTNEAVSLIENSVDQENLTQTFSKPLLQTKSSDKKLAYQMIQNILIPIPEDILNDADLTPDLTSSPDEKDLSANAKSTSQKANLSNQEKETGLFKSISSWFSRDKKSDKKSASDSKENDKALADAAKDKKNFFTLGSVDDYKPLAPDAIMPAELRLSFQPNRAEISGQTLKWIYAFADNARDNNDVYIEVRIDGTSSYVLQQKRLNLLSSIFSSRGVDWRKINPIFTSREPNSFIIRNIRFNNPEDKKGQNTR